MNSTVSRPSFSRRAGLCAAWVLGPPLAGWLLGMVLAPGASASYLDLQTASDPAHRLAVLVLPSAGFGLLLAALLATLGRYWKITRVLAKGVTALSLAVGAVMLSFIIGFDGTIEARGLEGQFERFPCPGASTPGDSLGPFAEQEEPGVATSPLPSGDIITLDRRTLARRAADGSIRWSRPRPGLPLATLWVIGSGLLYAGRGPTFEDDALIASVDLATGEPRWSFHCLGNTVLPPAVDGSEIVFATWRPSTSAVYLLHWVEPEVRWRQRLVGALDLPPRFGGAGVDLAQQGVVETLARGNGEPVSRLDACKPPGHLDVACRDGRVVAWTPREPP